MGRRSLVGRGDGGKGGWFPMLVPFVVRGVRGRISMLAPVIVR